MNIAKGESKTISATFVPENSFCDTDSEIVYTSSDKSIVAVDNGIITGKTVGEAVVTATYNGIEKQCTVTVTKPEPKSIYASDIEMDKGDDIYIYIYYYLVNIYNNIFIYKIIINLIIFNI